MKNIKLEDKIYHKNNFTSWQPKSEKIFVFFFGKNELKERKNFLHKKIDKWI